MRLLILRDHVYHQVRQAGTDSAPPPIPATSIEQCSLQAWQRRLRAVGGDPAALIPPSGALEWASPANTSELNNHGL
jgi:hypothetical protein